MGKNRLNNSSSSNFLHLNNSSKQHLLLNSNLKKVRRRRIKNQRTQTKEKTENIPVKTT